MSLKQAMLTRIGLAVAAVSAVGAASGCIGMSILESCRTGAVEAGGPRDAQDAAFQRCVERPRDVWARKR